MAVTAFSSGTQTATVTTEHAVGTVNQAGVYTFHVDLVNMVAGDVVELRAYQIVLTGGTKRIKEFAAFYGAQPTHALIYVSCPLSNELTDASSLEFSLKQTFGTGRNFPWKVLKHA